jgi:antitoxin MazE
MNIKLIKIGNSRGIRIPHTILQQVKIKDELEMEVLDEKLVLKPVKKARRGWDKVFMKMHQQKDDHLIIDDQIDLTDEEWIW